MLAFWGGDANIFFVLKREDIQTKRFSNTNIRERGYKGGEQERGGAGMALWLEMARIVLGRPCSRALRRLVPPMEPASLRPGPALRALRALKGALREAAGALASGLRRGLAPLVPLEALPLRFAARRPDASSASRARFAHPARGGFPHAGGKAMLGIDGKACAPSLRA